MAGGSDDLKNLLGEESAAKATLKNIFTKIWSSAPEAIAEAVLKFVERIKQGYSYSPVLIELVIFELIL